MSIGFPKPQKAEKKKRYYLPRRGKKTNQWDKCKRLLDPAFNDIGLYNMCEIGPILLMMGYEEEVEKHRHWFARAYAHGDKRNNLVGNEILHLVARACQDCHDFIEYRPDMREIVEKAIARRKVQPRTMEMEAPSL